MDGGTVTVTFKGDSKNLEENTDKVKSKLGGLGESTKSLGSIFKKSMVLAVAGVGALATAIGGVVTAGINSYADLEQNVGGIETLFKDSANTVIANAEKAYKTAGLSANNYMETVTSFSASLLQSVGNDTVKAANYADQAIIDMSDNANKMGTSMEMIQNAYQGFAKQNYTMLDNLKLGYGGTKTEMERLISDANKVKEANGEMANLSIDSFADITEAIHIIQTEMGITGTTALEAEETISGSINSLKASWDNFINGSGTVDDLVNSIITAGTNIGNVFIEMLPNITTGLVQLANALIPKIPGIIQNLFPPILSASIQILQSLIQALPTFITMLAQMIPIIIPELINGAVEIINSLAQALPTLLPIVVMAVLDGILSILDNIDLIIDAGIQLVMGLADGLINAIPIIVEKAPIIMDKLITAIANNLPKIIDMGIQVIKGLVKGLINSIPLILQSIPKIVTSLLNGFKSLLGIHIHSPSTVFANFGKMLVQGLVNGIKSLASNAKSAVSNIGNSIINSFTNIPSKMVSIGKNIIKGLWNGISGLKDWVVSKVASIGSSVLSGIKSVLGIHSPSTEFAIIGKYSILGYTEKLDSMKKNVQSTIDDVFSVDPTMYNNASTHFSPNVNMTVINNVETDPLGQVVNQVKTFSGGSKNDYNYGMGV